MTRLQVICPNPKEVDLWNHITDNDSNNYVGGQMPSENMPGYKEFSNARKEWMQAGDALQKIKDEIGNDSSGAFENMIMMMEDDLTKLELEGWSYDLLSELLEKQPYLALFFTSLSVKKDAQINVFKNFLTYVVENISSVQDFYSFLQNVYDDSYAAMVNAYASFVRQNVTSDGTKTGKKTGKLCPADQQVLDSIRKHQRSVQASLNQQTAGNYNNWKNIGGKPSDILNQAWWR